MAEFKGKLIEGIFLIMKKTPSVLFLILTHQMTKSNRLLY